MNHGDALEIAGFSGHVYSEEHALIHQDIPLVENTCLLVDGELFHSGDSFTVPEDPVSTLLLAISAPWLKVRDDRLLPRGLARPRLRDPERRRAGPHDQDDVHGRHTQRRASRQAKTRNEPGAMTGGTSLRTCPSAIPTWERYAGACRSPAAAQGGRWVARRERS